MAASVGGTAAYEWQSIESPMRQQLTGENRDFRRVRITDRRSSTAAQIRNSVEIGHPSDGDAALGVDLNIAGPSVKTNTHTHAALPLFKSFIPSTPFSSTSNQKKKKKNPPKKLTGINRH